jgi:hypothetical protein
MSDTVANLRLGHFEPLMGQQLAVELDAPTNATVTGVRPLGGHSEREGGGFAVDLLIAVVAPVQGIFPVLLPEFGRVELFMAPRKRVGDAVEYEIIFN